MLYFVRHPHTALSDGNFRGWVNVPLDEQGHREAQETAKYFKDKGVEAIHTSPLDRAVSVAQQIAKVTGAPIVRDSRLKPWHIGIFSGQEITPQRLVMMQALQENPEMKVPGGESYNDFFRRYSPAFHELMDSAKDKNVVMVAHHRNALAIPAILHGESPGLKGPPEPGGIMKVTKNAIREIYEPPTEEGRLYKKATS